MKNKVYLSVLLILIFGKIFGKVPPIDNKKLRIEPLYYTSAELKEFNTYSKAELQQLRYDMLLGDNALFIDKGAYQGIMGKFNKKAVKQRGKRYVKRIKKDGLNKRLKVHIEGDSWFNFPIALKSDISKILGKTNRTELLVSNSSYGGDLLTNMMFEHTYLDSLIKFKPETFIISGGGNDLIGNGNINYCIAYPDKNEFKKYINLDYIYSRGNNRDYKQNRTLNIEFDSKNIDGLIKKSDPNSIAYLNEVAEGSKFLTKEFFESIQNLEVFYRIMFAEIRSNSNLKDMQIITQGYDNVIPSKDVVRGLNPIRWMINMFTGTGKWLYFPMRTNGIDNKENQKKIMKAMIFYFNEMILDLTYEKDTMGKDVNPNNYHVDNRGLMEWIFRNCPGKETRYWFDEIHPRKLPFKYISRNYQYLIYNYYLKKSDLTQKSYKTVDLIEKEIIKKENIKNLREDVKKHSTDRVKY